MAWEQLSSMAQRNAEELLRAETEPPTECWYDGTTLKTRDDVVLHCGFCGRTYEPPYQVS
jgi:hypothetical protein